MNKVHLLLHISSLCLFLHKFLNKNGSKKTTHIEFKFSKDKSIKLQKNQEIKEVKKEKIGIELLEEIKKQRELLRIETEQICKNRMDIIKRQNELEEIIKHYEKVLKKYNDDIAWNYSYQE